MSARSTEPGATKRTALPAVQGTAFARIAAAPAAFTGAWTLLRAAATAPATLFAGFAAPAGPGVPLLLATGAGAAGAALLAAALLLARRSAGAWAAGVCLLIGLLALAVASALLLQRVDWIGALAAAITLLTMLAPPVREAFLA